MKGNKAQSEVDARTRATLGRRNSGASGQHGDRRTKRLRTRAAVQRHFIEEN